MPDRLRECQNCETPLPVNARYCPRCGQRNRAGIPTLGEFLADGFRDFFNVDSRFWRTVRDLFVPGKMTLAWFRGQRQRYLPPLRVALVTAFALVAAALYMIGEEDFMHMRDSRDERVRTMVRLAELERTDSLLQRWKGLVPDSASVRLLDTIGEELGVGERNTTTFFLPSFDPEHARRQANRQQMIQDSTVEPTIKYTFDNGSVEREGPDSVQGAPISTNFYRLDFEDIYSTKTKEELLEKYEVEHWLDRLTFQQILELFRRGENLGVYLLTSGAWTLLLVIPLAAGLLKLLYIRHDYLYLQHVIFMLHLNAATVVGLILIILLEPLSPAAVWLGGTLVLNVFIWFAMRKVYGQGRGKTFLKFTIMGLGYSLVLLPLVVFVVFIVRFLLY